MALVKTIQCKGGGTVRIFDDCMPKTQEERERRRAEVQRAVWRCLEEAVAAYGFEGARRRLEEWNEGGG